MVTRHADGERLPLAGSVSAGAKSAARQALAAGTGQLWWGYYQGDENSWNLDGGGGATTYCVAIRIPNDFVAKPGATVAAASIFMITSNFSNLKVWISKELPKSASEADMECVSVANGKVATRNFTDVAFAHEHAIPEEGLYVGYEFTVTNVSNNIDNYPLVYSGSADASGTFLVSMSGSGEWQDWSAYGESLVMRVLLSGDKFMQNAVQASGMGQRYTLLGGQADGYVSLLNRGLKGISSIDYAIDTEGTKGTEQHLVLPEVFSTLGGLTYVSIPMQADATTGNRLKTLRITRVNGQPNEAGEGNGKGALFTVAKKAPVTPVVEELTGNGCGWCPRGMVGLELLKKDFADRIVEIAVHYNDPMYVEDYLPVLAMTDIIPSAFISRRYNVDPYYGLSQDPYGVKKEVEAFFDEVTPASVEAMAQWADAAKTKIMVKTNTTFQFDSEEPLMGIGYVLVADGLKDDSWKQQNYYSGSTPFLQDGNLSPWVSEGTFVPGLEYNHVAVAAKGVGRGVEGSIAGPVKVGQTQQHTYLFDIPGNALVQDKEKLSVAVLLVNRLAGDVINGQQVAILPYDATGIDTVATRHSQVVSCYSADGRQLSAPQKGINILRYSDGRNVKVMR